MFEHRKSILIMESSWIFNWQKYILKRERENILQWEYQEVQKNKIPFIKRRESICISRCQRFSIIITIKSKESSRETLQVKNQAHGNLRWGIHIQSQMPCKLSLPQQMHWKYRTSRWSTHKLKKAKQELSSTKHHSLATNWRCVRKQAQISGKHILWHQPLPVHG